MKHTHTHTYARTHTHTYPPHTHTPTHTHTDTRIHACDHARLHKHSTITTSLEISNV